MGTRVVESIVEIFSYAHVFLSEFVITEYFFLPFFTKCDFENCKF